MPLWGTSADAITNRPKWCPTDEDSKHNRGDVFANQSGWVRKAGTAGTGNGNTSADPEILVAIGGLAGATDTTGLKAPTVVALRFVSDVPTDGSSKTVTVEVTYDEGVTVVTTGGTPTLTLANGNEGSGTGRTCVLSYTATGSTSNQIRFTASNITVAEDDVLTLGGGSQANISLNGGTISDTVRGGTNQAASLVLTGITAETITVTA